VLPEEAWTSRVLGSISPPGARLEGRGGLEAASPIASAGQRPTTPIQVVSRRIRSASSFSQRAHPQRSPPSP